MFLGEKIFKAVKVVSGRRRDRFDVIANILGVAQDRVKKYELRSQCFMSSRQLEGYLDLILRAKLITVENDGSSLIFRVSRKGEEFLTAYERLQILLK